MKSYQIHSAEDRHAVFAEGRPGIWREDDLLRMWVVSDAGLVVRVLRSPHTVISDLVDVVATVKTKYGIELPNVDYACGVLPVLVSDDVHPVVRRNFATFLAGRLAELDAKLPELARSSLAPLARKGRVDVVAQVVSPLIQKVFSIFLKSDMPSEFLTIHVTEILSFKAMVSHLKALDARIGRTLAYLRATTPDAEEVAWKFICLVFGVDSVAMMLAESLVMAFRQIDPANPAPARLPEFPMETGVPVSHRRAKIDFEIDGHRFAAGDLIRLQMQALGYSTLAENRKFIFGGGAHSCLGKQVSLRIWEVFRREFDGLKVTGRVIDYKLTPSHYIIFHDKVQVEVF
jgi:cytochrome P450